MDLTPDEMKLAANALRSRSITNAAADDADRKATAVSQMALAVKIERILIPSPDEPAQ